MTPLVKLFRTTAFKLSLAYLAIFAVGSALVLGRLGWNVQGLLDEQIRQTVDAEMSGLLEQYEAGGLRRLYTVINARARQPGSSLYLLTNNAGELIIGNVAALPDAVLGQTGIVETAYERASDPSATHRALARALVLSSGFRLLVGRDLEERNQLGGAVGQALVTSLIAIAVIGLFGGLFVASRVLRRIDGMTATTQTIMQGDLSGRLPIAGSGDELDRLARNLNLMLERITELMAGLKEVSDNIAHDLKTPLTRLRNRAEQALRGDIAAAPRLALESIIEESDGLIRVFDALLMIARAEAGSGRESMGMLDAAAVARDFGELFEPLAEEAGMRLTVATDPTLPMRGNRELIGQATVNLLDNAIKYGVPFSPDEDSPATAEVALSARRVDGRVEIAVADHGRGIPEIDRVRARERFVRLEDSRSKPGSGLGLSLASAVARLHGGELRLEDNRPGLRVVLSLPAAATVPALPLIPAPP